MAAAHSGPPAKKLVGGEAGDLQEVEGEPFRGLARAGGAKVRALHAEPAAAMASGGAAQAQAHGAGRQRGWQRKQAGSKHAATA